jgi:hypothetical protein
MIVAQKVQQAVESQDPEFEPQRMAVAAGLSACDAARNGQIAEIHGRSMA